MMVITLCKMKEDQSCWKRSRNDKPQKLGYETQTETEARQSTDQESYTIYN